MDFGDLEIIKSNGKYGLVNRINHSTVLDSVYEEIWAYDFLGKGGAFILSLENAYYLYDVAKDTVSESYVSMYVFDSHFLAVSQKDKELILLDPDLLFDKEIGHADNDKGFFVVFHIGDKVGLGVIGFGGGSEDELTVSSLFDKYHLESVLLYPDFDDVSLFFGEDMTSARIEAAREGLIYLYYFNGGFHGRCDKYSLEKGLYGNGYEQIRYGDNYVSAFRNGFWEMFLDGQHFVERSENISHGHRNPYLLIDGKLLIGQTLAGRVLCDSIEEIIEKHWAVGDFVRFAAYKADGKCGLWNFEMNKKLVLNNHYNSISPLYRNIKEDGSSEVTHFIVSDEKGQKGVFDVNRGCFIISCSYRIIFPVKCNREKEGYGYIESDILMGFLVSGFLTDSTGVLGANGEIICPLHFSNPSSEDEIKKTMITFVQDSQLWNGSYIGEDESPLYLLRAQGKCYAYYYWGQRILDQGVDNITVFQPNRKRKDDYYIVVKCGDLYGLYQNKLGLHVIEDINCDEIRLIEDLECFLIVKNGKSSLYSFKEPSV